HPRLAAVAWVCYGKSGRQPPFSRAMASAPEPTPSQPSMVCPRCRATYDKHKTFCPVDGARLTDRLEHDILEESPSAPCASIIAGRYQVGSLIGQGSMARVYSAKDLATQKNVAVKILARRFAESESERRRFFHEARAAFSIDHPNVVKVMDVGRRIDGRPFIVIERLEGESLGECLRRRKHLPVETALPILRDAALGLAAVHDAGIVHRDVKPDNIFLVGLPDAPEAIRLVDFGLAKLHGGTTRTGKTVGTAAYMPPEQVLSEGVDARADIYALGVVAFRVLTGHLPFESPKDIDMLAQQVLVHAPPLHWLLEPVDPRLEALVAKAIRKHPDNRYPTMRALAQDLQHILDGSSPAYSSALSVEPDAYLPVTDLGKATAFLFCQKLGVQPPWISGVNGQVSDPRNEDMRG
ncbi:MAG TPA: serine/threonine-protein kinase, partial [Polyangiaceae bacterium]|nr:serine/threonine-protein kinase [Polyangiaceae bacterium]